MGFRLADFCTTLLALVKISFVYYVNFAQRLSHKIKIIYENSRLSKTELLKLKINMNSIYAICAYLKQNIQSKFEEFEKQLLEKNNETPKYLKIKQDFEDLISTLERKCYMTDKYTFLSQIFGAIFENLFKMSKHGTFCICMQRAVT